MNLQDFYLLSQIIASLAVVVTLLFVGFQLKESNRQSRLSALQTSVQFEMSLTTVFADHAATWDKVITGQPLAEGEEKRRGIVMFNMLLSESQNRYYQFHHGHLDRQSWEGRKSSLELLVRLPVYEMWRNSIGGKNHTADFLNYLESLRKTA